MNTGNARYHFKRITFFLIKKVLAINMCVYKYYKDSSKLKIERKESDHVIFISMVTKLSLKNSKVPGKCLC